MRAFLAILVVLIAGAAAAVYSSAFIVHQNQQALVLEFGNPKRAINCPLDACKVNGKTQGPGLYWKLPLVQTVSYFDRRILDLDTKPQEVTASDQKRLVVDAFARYRIVNPLEFYKTVGTEENVRSRLAPIVESAIRRVLGATTFQDVVRNRREELMRRIATQVNQEGKTFGLEVVDVRIKRADLPEQNSKSVFERMRAERQREAAEFRAEGQAAANRIQATADREVTVIKADATNKGEQLRGQGEAERNRIFAEAFQKDADFFAFYRSMQAYDQGLNASGTRLVISPDTEFFRYFTDPSGTAPSSQRPPGQP